MKKIICKKAFIIFVLLLLIFSFLFMHFKIAHFKNKEKEITNSIKNTLENTPKKEDIEKPIFQDGNIGLLKIPSLGLEAPIHEGTSGEILKYWIRTF